MEPLWVEGAGHNDIELYSSYLERLKRFVGDDMKIPMSVTLNGASLGNNTSETGNSGDTGVAVASNSKGAGKINSSSIVSTASVSNNNSTATVTNKRSSHISNTSSNINIIGTSGAANADTMQHSSNTSPSQPLKSQNGVIAPSASPIVSVKSS